jgi:opacity protein-like surface antigen
MCPRVFTGEITFMLKGRPIAARARMTPSRSARVLQIGVFSLALAVFAVPAWAQQEGEELPPGPGEGGIIAVTFAPAFTFNGDVFDGQTWYKEIDGEEVMLLPKLDQHASFRGVLGFRKGPAALEIGYERMKFNGSFAEVLPMEATFWAVNFDGRLFFLKRSRVQPYVLGGLSIPNLTIKDGSAINENGDQLGDAKFSGYGLNTEAGVSFYPVRRVGIGIGYSYRVFWFDRADSGVSDKQFELRPRFRETAGSVVFQFSFIM